MEEKKGLNLSHTFYHNLRWPDTIYLLKGRLFSIQIFDRSATFDCRDILDAEKEMLEVYQKGYFYLDRYEFAKIVNNFLDVVFKENAYYWEN